MIGGLGQAEFTYLSAGSLPDFTEDIGGYIYIYIEGRVKGLFQNPLDPLSNDRFSSMALFVMQALAFGDTHVAQFRNPLLRYTYRLVTVSQNS